MSQDANGRVPRGEATEMTQTQIPSTQAQSYTFGIELELTLPISAIREYGIQIGSYHHGIQLP